MIKKLLVITAFCLSALGCSQAKVAGMCGSPDGGGLQFEGASLHIVNGTAYITLKSGAEVITAVKNCMFVIGPPEGK